MLISRYQYYAFYEESKRHGRGQIMPDNKPVELTELEQKVAYAFGMDRALETVWTRLVEFWKRRQTLRLVRGSKMPLLILMKFDPSTRETAE